ncbi:hypothetical protein KEJ18_02745 [Candidatus Bathyarchaeota archaeon]|nr:hypothetical protein [Candidatus Bathyarchaeota archaeon]
MNTVVAISDGKFLINGVPTYPGRTYNGHLVEGLLMNSRMVQAVFDDENPETRVNWSYPDTGVWDPERNTDEFVGAMKSWRDSGLLAFTVNFQGGNPRGYGERQPWHNSAFNPDGSMKAAYLRRMRRVLDEADKLGMVVIVGYFYFGQDWRLLGEEAVKRAVVNATEWLLESGHRNVLVEINNECDIRYTHRILKAPHVHGFIEEVKAITKSGRRLLVSASFSGQKIPTDNVISVSDFILVHGNGPENPDKIEAMVKTIRESPKYCGQPIVFNEDDHFNFSRKRNHMMAAIENYASWGYFDPGVNNYWDGYQCPPVNWSINTRRKRSFFKKLREVTGVQPVVENMLPQQT